jgi:ribosome-binding factor A
MWQISPSIDFSADKKTTIAVRISSLFKRAEADFCLTQK